MTSYIFDIEANGLLHEKVEENDLGETITTPPVSRVHCIVIKCRETGERRSFANTGEIITNFPPVEEGLKILADADLIIGHNIIRYDLPALFKIYGFVPKGQVRDTIVSCALIWPRDILRAKDFNLARKGDFPKNLIARHSLEAWGRRIGTFKGSFDGPWTRWTPEMQAYCEQDVETTFELDKLIVAKKYSEAAIQLEHDLAPILFDQEEEGVCFDEKAAGKLYSELVAVREEITRELRGVFPPLRIETPFTPKTNSKKYGYVKGVPTVKVKMKVFNPGSRDHIAERLTLKYGWKPTDFNDDGTPTVDEDVLRHLRYKEVPLLMRFLLVQKRIGQLAEGKQALLKHVKDERIHGEVEQNGTITGRASHKKPNLGQVPKVKKHKERGILKGEEGEWGFEFRSLFIAPPGWKMLGVDASGLELRMLGHYLHRWDAGKYAHEVVQGDVHAITLDALGDLCESRDMAKMWFYAYLYGAGDEKLGKILKKNKAAGARSRALFLKKLLALKYLVDAIKSKHNTQKFIIGLDKRIVYTRSEHAALNTLLQSAGALVCKAWLVFMHRMLRAAGFVKGRDYVQVLWVHDEVQLYVRPDKADAIGKIAVQAVKVAGNFFALKVPLDGEYKIGNNWAETH